MNYIHEITVYDELTKKWRVLNLTTETVYSADYGSHLEASSSIEANKIRDGAKICAWDSQEVKVILTNAQNAYESRLAWLKDLNVLK